MKVVTTTAKRSVTKKAPMKNPSSKKPILRVTKDPFKQLSSKKTPKGKQPTRFEDQRAGSIMYANVYNSGSKQNKRGTGKTLLAKAMGKLALGK